MIALLSVLFLCMDQGGRYIELPRSHLTFAGMKASDAEERRGEWLTCVVRFASSSAENEGQLLYECEGHDDVYRTIWFREPVALDETAFHLIRARLRVITHPDRMIDGTQFQGFTEFRLVNARLIRP